MLTVDVFIADKAKARHIDMVIAVYHAKSDQGLMA